MKINLNDNIKVKLTLHGLKILYGYYGKYRQSPPSKSLPDKEGNSQFQLWDFANIFGPHFYNGSEQVIEENLVEI